MFGTYRYSWRRFINGFRGLQASQHLIQFEFSTDNVSRVSHQALTDQDYAETFIVEVFLIRICHG